MYVNIFFLLVCFLSKYIWATLEVNDDNIARQYLQDGIAMLHTEPFAALEAFQKSFRLHPTLHALDQAYLVLELLGQQRHQYDWMIETSSARAVFAERLAILDRILQGRELTTQEKFGEALQLYEEILETYPLCPEALFLKGAVLEKVGEIENAAISFMKVIDSFPIHTQAILSLGTIHQKYGDFVDSFPIYEKACQIYELYLEVSKQLGEGILVIHDDYLKVQGNLILAYFQRAAYDKVSTLALSLEIY